MKMFVSILSSVVAAGLLTGCGNGSSSQNPGTNTATTSASASPAGYLGSLVNAKNKADKTIDVSYLNQALQLFNVQEGRFPKTLEELTPKYVAQIPVAPIGYKLDYDATKGEVKMVAQ
jgi:outer membrane PBP1 activator LpoA protein